MGFVIRFISGEHVWYVWCFVYAVSIASKSDYLTQAMLVNPG